MIPLVKTKTQKLENYKGIISDELFEEIKILAKNFQKLKVVMINSTPKGGGVAEILKSLVPLMKGVGIDAAWHTLLPDNSFFAITKEIHNSLQGKKANFSSGHKKKYLNHIKKNAFLLKDKKADIWIAHDPQPAGLILYVPSFYPSVSHVHIDLTSPDHRTWDFFSEIFKMYDKVIFSSKEFVQKEIKTKSIVFPPAIDPLTEKNQPLDQKKAKLILEKFGINIKKPLITQVSRFDPWKDPLGVVEAYKIAKKKIPDLQLALIGLFLAQDDPEARKVFKEVENKSKGDKDIFLFSDVDQIGELSVDVFVNAFQAASDIILQKSIREGFGLTVTEAMWKEKAVIGGNATGIINQIKNNKNGFLVSSPKEAAKKIVQLIKNSALTKKIGKAAKAQVKEKFLMPRILRDYLKLFKNIV